MELIKEIKKENKTLKHFTYIDGFGFKKDSIELVEMDEKGHLTLIPFLPDIKVKTYSREDNIFDQTETYTDEEYNKMLNNY